MRFYGITCTEEYLPKSRASRVFVYGCIENTIFSISETIYKTDEILRITR